MPTRRTFIKSIAGAAAGSLLFWNAILPQKVISKSIRPPLEAEQFVKDQNSKLLFVVVSDIHIERVNAIKHFSALLTDNVDSKLDAMVVVGDLGDGLSKHYNILKRILAEHRLTINYPIFWTIGNHEFYGGFYEKGVWSPKTFPNKESDAAVIDRFLTFAGRNKIYSDTWLNGYHFVFLGPEKSRMSNLKYMDLAYLSDSQLNWLENVLNKDKKPHKPIFVFLHQPIPYATLEGVQRGYVIQWQKLKTILSQHPEVIFFNGHTHYEIDYKYMDGNEGFSIVNSSSLAYPIDRNRKHIINSAQGLVVEAYDEKVIIRGREFLQQSWIGAAEMTVPL